MIVALADSLWRGRRLAVLEAAMTKNILAATALHAWQVTMLLEEIIEPIAAEGDKRLAWQQMIRGLTRNGFAPKKP